MVRSYSRRHLPHKPEELEFVVRWLEDNERSFAAGPTKPHLSGSRHKEPTVKGTTLDFLKLAAEKPELARELVLR